jgi:hypothetical protein
MRGAFLAGSGAQVVQARLDNLLVDHAYHKIRRQRKILLPSGANRITIYQNPDKWDGEDLLISIPSPDVDRLLVEYDNHHLTQFDTDEEVSLFADLHAAVGSPSFTAKHGWAIFSQMVNKYCDRMQVS